MAQPPVRALELERFEATFNLSRVGGAALTYFLGPFFPNIGIQHVALFGGLLLAQSALVAYLLRSGILRRHPDRVERVIFAIDLITISYGIFLFSYDPNWTTYIAGLLLIIAGGFRFAGMGAAIGAVVMAIAYVCAAIYRDTQFGFATEPQRIAFTVTIYLLAGFLMVALLRELTGLRAQRDSFERQRIETEGLRELDRMKSEFLAAMSHDFRSPLTVVRGNLELMLSERPGSLTSAQRDLASRAQRNVHRLEDFTEDLLEMARIEHGTLGLERDDVDICALVRDVVEDHVLLAEQRGQRFDVTCDGLAIVSADAGRLRRVVGNLLSNAMRYGPGHTPITIDARRDGGVFEVRVTDRGPGVDLDEREQIFEKFSRGRRSAGVAGAGLGLSIARSLAELHGGTLSYAEPADGGACFVLRIPAATP